MDGVTPAHTVGIVDRVSAVQSERIRGDGRGKRSSAIRLDDAAELPSGRGPAQNAGNALGARNAPGIASLKILRHVEIRGTASKPRIEYIKRCDPILELIGICRAGTAIYTPAIRVRRLRLKSVTHPLADLELEGMKDRVRSPKNGADGAKVRV